jgi:hypothetical protein
MGSDVSSTASNADSLWKKAEAADAARRGIVRDQRIDAEERRYLSEKAAEARFSERHRSFQFRTSLPPSCLRSVTIEDRVQKKQERLFSAIRKFDALSRGDGCPDGVPRGAGLQLVQIEKLLRDHDDILADCRDAASGETPLMLAARLNLLPVCRALVERGFADLRERTHDGWTARLAAEERGNADIIAYFDAAEGGARAAYARRRTRSGVRTAQMARALKARRQLERGRGLQGEARFSIMD